MASSEHLTGQEIRQNIEEIRAYFKKHPEQLGEEAARATLMNFYVDVANDVGMDSAKLGELYRNDAYTKVLLDATLPSILIARGSREVPSQHIDESVRQIMNGKSSWFAGIKEAVTGKKGKNLTKIIRLAESEAAAYEAAKQLREEEERKVTSLDNKYRTKRNELERELKEYETETRVQIEEKLQETYKEQWEQAAKQRDTLTKTQNEQEKTLQRREERIRKLTDEESALEARIKTLTKTLNGVRAEIIEEGYNPTPVEEMIRDQLFEEAKETIYGEIRDDYREVLEQYFADGRTKTAKQMQDIVGITDTLQNGFKKFHNYFMKYPLILGEDKIKEVKKLLKKDVNHFHEYSYQPKKDEETHRALMKYDFHENGNPAIRINIGQLERAIEHIGTEDFGYYLLSTKEGAGMT